MKVNREVAAMLAAAGFMLARANRHAVYKRGDDTITVALSPRSRENQVAWVRQEIARRNRKAA